MAIVSSSEGSPTNTGWNRRSSAASFSMCLRYSSSVVAPTTCSSPRASAGLSMLEASTAPSAAPAPTRVCSSSMKTMYLPSALVISFRTALRRSSNSPRYFVPATSAPRSSPTKCLFLSESGTSPFTIRCASPSTIAVLPTPGSPISTGLFLVRRDSTCITPRSSASRPITASSVPFRACSVSSARPFPLAAGPLEHPAYFARQRRLRLSPRLLRDPVDLAFRLVLPPGHVEPRLLEQRNHDAVVLRQQRVEEMGIVDDRVAAL